MGWLCGVGVFGQSVLTLSRPCTADSKINQSRDETPRLRGGLMIFHFRLLKPIFYLNFVVLFPYLITLILYFGLILIGRLDFLLSCPLYLFTGCSKWIIISVGDYIDNSFTALGSSDSPGKLGSSSS